MIRIMDFSHNGVYNNPSQLNDVDSSACDNSQCMRITSVHQGQAQEDHLIEIATYAENIHPGKAWGISHMIGVSLSEPHNGNKRWYIRASHVH